MRLAHRKVLLAERNRHIETDGRQPLGQQQFVAPCGDLLGLSAADPVHILQNTLYGPPCLHQFAGAFFADARDPRNVVGRIAPQGQNVAHERGIVNAVLLADRLAVHDLDAAVALLFVDAAAVAHELSVVLVGRYHVDVVSGFGSPFGERTDHVVRFVVLDFEDRNAHRLQNPLDIGDRKQNVLRGLRAVGLVLGIDRAAERPPLRVERHAQQIGTLAFLDVAQELRETEDHRGVHAGPVAHRPAHEGVVVFEYQCIGIDQKEFFHNRMILWFSSAAPQDAAAHAGPGDDARPAQIRSGIIGCPPPPIRHRRLPFHRVGAHGAKFPPAGAVRCGPRSRRASSRRWVGRKW